MFIHLTKLVGGGTIIVQTERINVMTPFEQGTRIAFTGTDFVDVVETPDWIFYILRQSSATSS